MKQGGEGIEHEVFRARGRPQTKSLLQAVAGHDAGQLTEGREESLRKSSDRISPDGAENFKAANEERAAGHFLAEMRGAEIFGMSQQGPTSLGRQRKSRNLGGE